MRISGSIYLDHQATTPVPEQVVNKMMPYFYEKFGNPHSVDHSLGWKSAHEVEKATEQISNFIGAFPDEIYFTSGATESNNLALIGLARKVSAKSKRTRFLLSEIEHKCVQEAGKAISHQFTIPVDHIPVNKEGRVSLNVLENMLGNDVLVVSIMAVNNEIGTIQDIDNISRLVRNAGAIFHCDAAQAPIAMDIQELTEKVDILSLSAHKMYGPKGIGIIFVRRELRNLLEPLFYGGGQQNGLRPGTIPTPLVVGMSAATEFLTSKDIYQKRLHLSQMREKFIDKLVKLPWPVKLNGVGGHLRHPGNANLCFMGFVAKDILQLLQPKIAASTGSACSSGIIEPSYVLKSLGLSFEDIEASIRFSLGFDTTYEDIEEGIGLINQSLLKLSKIRY